MLTRIIWFTLLSTAGLGCIDPPSGSTGPGPDFGDAADAMSSDAGTTDVGPLRDVGGSTDGSVPTDAGGSGDVDLPDLSDPSCDASSCDLPASCAEIAAAMVDAPTGLYTIDPDGDGDVGPIEVHCDMETDGGVGYTMLRVEDPALQANESAAAYIAACEALGLELVVPRSRGHALALLDYIGEPPNVVGVFPSEQNARGLDNYEGRCQGEPCRFYLSDSPDNNANCERTGQQPDGTNTVDSPLYYRDTPTTGCPIGRYDDAENYVRDTGFVTCSTNDVGPPTLGSCLEVLQANAVQNTKLYGINGLYTVQPAGASAPLDIYCDFIRDGGGYGYLKVEMNTEFTTPDAEAHCAQFGMRLMIPRTRQHRLNASAVGREDRIGPSGNTDYLELLGVYPESDGASCASQPLNSDNPTCQFRAGDDGPFFVHGVDAWLEPDGSDGLVDDSLEYSWSSEGELQSIEDRPDGTADTVRFLCIVGDKQ